MQAAGQPWLFEVLRAVAQPHLDLATDSIPAGAPGSPMDVLLAHLLSPLIGSASGRFEGYDTGHGAKLQSWA
jgi:hypothetical protein